MEESQTNGSNEPEITEEERGKRPDALSGCAGPSSREARSEETTIGAKRPDALSGCAGPSSREARSEEITIGTKRPDALSGMVFHAMRMMVGTLLSRILGLIREMLTAALFGATRQLDAFFVAYTIANLSRQLLAEGALSASFVPVFSRSLAADGCERARRLSNEALSVLILGCSAVIAAGVLLAPAIVDIMAPGFAPAERSLAIALSRAMFPFLILVSVGALAMGVLNSMGSFFIPAVAPAVSNLAYILFLVATRKHLSVWNLAFAVLIGGLFHMMLQLCWCSKLKMPLRPAVPRKNDAQLRSMMALFLPYAAGLSLNQLNPVISRMLGSFLSAGSISVLTYADRVLQLPLGLFVITISQAVLPMLSRQDPNKTAEFRDFVRDAIRFNLFVILPVAVGLATVSGEVVHILFYRGAFSEWARKATSTALSLYALGLPGMASNTVIMRAIYARRMPRAAVMVTGVTVCVNLGASVLLMRSFGYAGLAAASAAAFTSAAIFAARLLSRSIGEKLSILEVKWLFRIMPPLLLLAAFLSALKFFAPYPKSSGVVLRLLWLLAAAGGGASVYAASTVLARCPEWKWIKGAVAKKRS
ncbi:MAG: murein biosynthesis integral membrane protein MurJ [Synergistes jonesii]|uniref:murein biosynthesis integral membrane protein MurJ n=1 Tax=Synergistes jonesii TaxID=2754 RepID=UPI002A74A0F7|nr:murein biosynthesis integral membrane protein MurJ [Synergistes jonesii]MDY2985411.1 murein biosynthesis integral membrane protein MurJ [Synergistes jonesii]